MFFKNIYKNIKILSKKMFLFLFYYFIIFIFIFICQLFYLIFQKKKEKKIQKNSKILAMRQSENFANIAKFSLCQIFARLAKFI